MPLSESTIRALLEHAGLQPTAEQIKATSEIHSALSEQLDRASPQSLDGIEPQYIRPARNRRRRRL